MMHLMPQAGITKERLATLRGKDGVNHDFR
jgi:hypothetical protein